jgi:hypothetical protein
MMGRCAGGFKSFFVNFESLRITLCGGADEGLEQEM